jgi:hypothetical protein
MSREQTFKIAKPGAENAALSAICSITGSMVYSNLSLGGIVG